MEKIIKILAKLAEFLQDNNKQFSAMRLIFLLGMSWAMGFTTAWAFGHPATSAAEIIALFSGLSGTFIVLKLGQKPMEKNKEDTKK